MSATQTENSIPEFIYEPLPDADSYIRLISILDFDDTQRIPIHCELTTWAISDLPDYRAISYTWGDANDPATILINGSRMQVSKNCEYTLRQAAQYGGNFPRRYHWVDAICINQDSNEEKGPQVALMGQIYTNAERVLACVGKSTVESRFLYRTLHRDSWYYRNARDGEANPVVSLRKPSPETVIRIICALCDFLKRPYFWRLWVYQELFLGREVIVCCGKQHISAHVLHGLVVTQSSRLVGIFGPGIIFYPASYIVPLPSLVLEVGVLNLAPTTLTAALGYAKYLDCTDPRDRIYGVLSTINWPNKDPIRPDYTKDRLDIAFDALKIVDEENCPDGHSYVEIIRHIFDSLDLSGHTSSQLRDAIQRRFLGCTTQLANRNQGICRKPHRLRGWCLAYEDGRWTLEGFAMPVYEVPISVQQQSDYVKSPNLKPGLLLPPVTRPGDWCIFNAGQLVLIARPRLDGHFDIVGKAFPSFYVEALFQGLEFDVYFGYEDIMVLIETSWACHYNLNPLGDEVTEYLETKVCGQAGSSYATKVPQ